MKKLFITLLMMCSLSAFCKEYTEVVEVKGKTADQLYSSAREWFAETFNSANDVLQMDDPTAGKLIGKGYTVISESYVTKVALMQIPGQIDFKLWYTVKIYIKEGRYKYEIKDFYTQFNNVSSQQIAYDNSKKPYSVIEDSLEYYKKATDKEWLIKDLKRKKVKYAKTIAKCSIEINKSMVKCIEKVDPRIQAVVESLKQAMASAKSEDW